MDGDNVTDTPLDAGTLFRRFAPFVARFLGRLGVAPHDVDDLVQEVFVVAHRHGGYVPGPAQPTTWLANIATNIAATHARSHRRRKDRPDEELLALAVANGKTPSEALEIMQSLRRVQTALEQLDFTHRAVLVLFEWEGQTCEQIAAAMGVPVGTIYSRLHNARRDLNAAHARLLAAEQRSTVTHNVPATGLP